MTPLEHLLQLSHSEKERRGLLHTPAEIAQQPETWAETFALIREQRSVLTPVVDRVKQERRTVFLIGAGTSEYIGHALAPLLRQSWGVEVAVTPSTDLLAAREDVLLPGRRYFWIHFSRSGQSPEGVAVLESAIRDLPDVRHLVITCNADGSMARLARDHAHSECIVLSDRVNDRSLAMTSSFTNMVVAGHALAFISDKERYEPIVAAMQRAAEYMLSAGSELAERLAGEGLKRACFVGTGAQVGTAKESALKLLELTSGRLQTFSESTLGLRHGPMSALNTDTLLTISVSTDERRRRYDLDLLAEVSAKKTTRAIVAIGAEGTPAAHHLFCEAFREIPDSCRPPVDVLFGQLLGLFASINAGFRPDAPSPDGIITRVVQPFAIYN